MEEVESTGGSAAAAAAKKKLFVCMNCILIAMGSLGGPLLMRLYFVRGGSRIWFASWLQTGGCPIMLIPLLICYTRRREKPILMNSRVFWAASVIGLLAGVDAYLYSYGAAKLPVSTSSLIIATQLAFTAAFAFLLVKQRFTAYSINAVVLLTVAAAVLGLHASGDRPQGESDRMYWLGFALTAAAAALYGLIMPLLELTYKKADQAVTYNLVMEIQLVMSLSATAFCTVGMLINHDFQAIQREAKEFELGEKKYYLVVVGCAIVWQCVFLGINGVVFYASSLFSGIFVTLCLPITEVLAVIFYHENFQAEKGLSLFLSLWGFISYFWGDFKSSKELHSDYNSDNDQRPQAAIQTTAP